jgi:hypothetical protein
VVPKGADQRIGKCCNIGTVTNTEADFALKEARDVALRLLGENSWSQEP